MSELTEDLGYARPDFDRARRQGVGEVVYGAGKTADQIAGICASLARAGQNRTLITRLDAEKAQAVRALMDDPDALTYLEDARLAYTGGLPDKPDGDGLVVVAAAGTSDLPVAEEAAVTAEFLGNEVARLYDVGVAGIHRLLACEDVLSRAQVVIAVAGM